MHGDQRAQPRLGLVADHDLLVLVEEPQSAASIALGLCADLRPDLRPLGQAGRGEEARREAAAESGSEARQRISA